MYLSANRKVLFQKSQEEYNRVMHKCFSFFNNGLLLIANQALREMCPNTEFFLVRIFLFLDRIRRFTP